MTNSNEPKMRTITLTDAPPVRIREDDWPVIAHGAYRDHDNEYEFQANRRWKADVRVRQHADGRMIVYGVYDYDTVFQGERGITIRAGVVLDAGADPVSAIRTVGETLDEALAEAGFDALTPQVSEATRDCIADLPAVEL